jgi:hypothetical protein
MTPLGPHEMARCIEYRHRPWWVVWYGRWTGQYWALPSWVSTSHGMLCAATPGALDAAIATFEMLYPKPSHDRAHAVDH